MRDEWRQGQTVILTQSSSDHSSTSSSSWLGLLSCGSLRAQSPLSVTGSQFGILSPTDFNWLGPPWAPCYIIVSCPPASQFFRLFTQVHFLIDGSFEGQYITLLHMAKWAHRMNGTSKKENMAALKPQFNDTWSWVMRICGNGLCKLYFKVSIKNTTREWRDIQWWRCFSLSEMGRVKLVTIVSNQFPINSSTGIKYSILIVFKQLYLTHNRSEWTRE